MDLIYLYPKRDNAPANVGKSILNQLANHKDRLPFDDIKLLGEDKNSIGDDYGFNRITFSELLFYPKDYMVHISISPYFFFNKKFFLHILSKIRKKPLILHYHGDIRNYFLTKIKHETKIDIIAIPSVIFMPLLLRQATKVVTHSYIIGKILENQYGIYDNIVIPNGVDEFWFKPLQNKKYPEFEKIINKEDFNIFYHGRLSPEKGMDILIEAMAHYIRNNPKTMLFIAGGGSQEKDLQKLCLKLNLDTKVVFLGFLDKETVKFFLKNVDIAIYPSRFDNFPLAMLEALATADCPVYLSKKAGISDFIIKNKSEINLFEPTVTNIVKILNQSSELENNINSITTQQKKFADEYKWDKIFNQYATLYNELYSSFTDK